MGREADLSLSALISGIGIDDYRISSIFLVCVYSSAVRRYR